MEYRGVTCFNRQKFKKKPGPQKGTGLTIKCKVHNPASSKGEDICFMGVLFFRPQKKTKKSSPGAWSH